MEDQAVIGAVRLSDKTEMEQPDPLILSAQEVQNITWRHFETLLKSMYTQPPESIKVKYLDDENDWVELSSDSELAEALKYTRESGEILQLSVKSSDTNSLLLLSEAKGESEGRNPALYTYIPTTDPGGDVHRPSEDPQQPATDHSNLPPPLLVYPQSQTNSEQAPIVFPALRLQPAFPISAPAPQDSTPAPQQLLAEKEQPQQQQQPSEALMYPHPAPQGTTARPPPPLAPAAPTTRWDQAASLSCEEKLQFLKSWVEYHGMRSMAATSTDTSREGSCDSSDSLRSSNSRVAPLCDPASCSHKTCLGKNSAPNQDPFEVAGDGERQQKTSGEILVPTQACPPGTKSRSSSETSSSSSSSSSSVDISMPTLPLPPPTTTTTTTTRPSTNSAAIIPKSSYTSGVVPKAKLAKKLEAGVPVPMPRNLLMLEGAQSGANAVAIEMPSEPEYYPTSGLNKDEEIAASGGAASTSASEETGEVVARGGGSHAASVDRHVPKSTTQADSCAVSSPLPSSKNGGGNNTTVVTKQPVKMRLSLAKKEQTTQQLGTGAKPKVIEKKTASSSEAKKAVQGKRLSSEKKSATTDDIESQGAVAKAGIKQKMEDATLQYNDFVKHMKKLKKDLHCSVVKDVAKQTDKLLKKRFNRSLSQGATTHAGDFCNTKSDNGPVIHKGITCDHCDMEIVGVRYKCGNCEDFDLCEACESSEFVHDPTHVFLKLRKPARNAGVVLGAKTFRVPLLKENVYEAERRLLDFRKFEKMEEKLSEAERSGLNLAKLEKAAEKEAKKEIKRKEKEVKKEGKRKMREKKKAEKAKKVNDEMDGVKKEEKKVAETIKIRTTRPASQMEEIMEKVEERQAHQERVQPRDWSPYEEVPLKMNSPAELEELYDMMWQEKQKLAVTDETRCVTESRNNVTARQSVERTYDDEDHFEEEPLLPVVRDRTHSDSSGSSIVRIPHPSEVIEEMVAPQQEVQSTQQTPVTESGPMVSLPESEAAEVRHKAEQEEEEAIVVDAVMPIESLDHLLKEQLSAQDKQDNKPSDQPIEGQVAEEVRVEEVKVEEETVTAAEEVKAEEIKAEEVRAEEEAVAEPEEEEEEEEAGSSDSSYVCYETDSSEDFCVLDHPGHPDDYEEIQQSDDDEEKVSDCTGQQQQAVAVAAPEEKHTETPKEESEPTVQTNDPVPTTETQQDNNDETGEADVPLDTISVGDIVDVPMGATVDFGDDDSLLADLVHPMSKEEKSRFLNLLKAEKLSVQEEQAKKKCQADIREHREMKLKLAEEMRMADLERDLRSPAPSLSSFRDPRKGLLMMKKRNAKKRAQQKYLNAMPIADYREILEVKTMQAALENDRLEEAALEEEARRMMEEEEEELKEQRAKDPTYYRLLVTERRVGQILDLEMQKFAALNAQDTAALAAIQARLSELDLQKRLDEKRLELVMKDSWKVNGFSNVAASLSCAEERSSLSPQDSTASTTTSECDSVISDIEAGPGETAATTTSTGTQQGGAMVVGEGKRDANCQTMPAAAHPPLPVAGHLIHNVATGMSKAASTAFSTAKDVFYSLQAKQNEWKASSGWKPPTNTYVPPTSKWTPPEDTYVPPKNDYVPPRDDYVPPADTYVPKTSTWIPPPGTFLPPVAPSLADARDSSSTDTPTPTSHSTGGVAQRAYSNLPASSPTPAGVPTSSSTANPPSTTSSSSSTRDSPNPTTTTGRKTSMTMSLVPSPMSTSPFVSLDMADSPLRKELASMQHLIEMGFANREQNRQLLARFEGDMEKVVQVLLQEEGQDHWAFQRH